VRVAIAAGVVLGVVSRIEEVVDGFDVGISSNVTWLTTAFVVSALATADIEWGAITGAAALTAANAGYYAYIALTEQATELDSVAGEVEDWFALGVTGGCVFGVAGALARLRRFPPPTLPP
jgi:hypothetical protein